MFFSSFTRLVCQSAEEWNIQRSARFLCYFNLSHFSMFVELSNEIYGSIRWQCFCFSMNHHFEFVFNLICISKKLRQQCNVLQQIFFLQFAILVHLKNLLLRQNESFNKRMRKMKKKTTTTIMSSLNMPKNSENTVYYYNFVITYSLSLLLALSRLPQSKPSHFIGIIH